MNTIVDVELSPKELDALDLLVEQGIGKNRVEVLQEAVRRLAADEMVCK